MRLPGISSTAICSLLLAATTSYFSTPSHAQLELDFSAIVERIENPTRQPQSDQDELLSSLSARAQWERNSRLVDTIIDYNLVTEDYAEDLLSDQERVEGSGTVTFKIVPDLFDWQVQNLRSNETIDISRPDIVDNQQVINYSSTGPRVTFFLDSATLVNANADLGQVDYAEAEELNQERNSYNIQLTRLLGRQFSAGIRSNFTETDYDTLETLNFETFRLTAVASLTRDSYLLTLEAGEHTTRRAGQEINEPIVSLYGRYSLNSRLELSAEFSETVQDLLSDLRATSVVDQSFIDTEIEVDSNLGNSDSSNIYQLTNSSIGVTYADESRYTVGLRFSNRERTNLGAADSETDENISFNLQLPIGSRFTLNASASYSEIEFPQIQSTQERTELGVSGTYELSDNVSLFFSAFSFEQNGSLTAEIYTSRNFALGLLVSRR